tara:strand:- start:159 stop:791 length:633 start_codon:yes stop_codon:yes gene_type:complete
MHNKINVLAFGSDNFNTSLEELKDYLNFKLTTYNSDLEKKNFADFDILLIHENGLKNNSNKEILLKNTSLIKIVASNSNSVLEKNFAIKLNLPTSVSDINQLIENSVIKKSFYRNSSIKVKDYILDKNEKKLFKGIDCILLTEKEIQLLELFLNYSKPISKDKILEEVWRYASEADTHTVETHIYRLRKKIKTKFLDENFILNNKKGYFL